MSQKIVFMGTPHFAVPSLQNLIDSPFDVIAIYSQPPRPAGRGKKLTPSPVHQLADNHHIPVHTPKKFTPDAIAILAALEPDFICVAAYGLILPQAVLDIAPCLNVHPSALPRWRGAAPLQHTILSGDPVTHVCIMHMEAGLDTGPVYLRKAYEVDPNETTGTFHDRMAHEGAKSLVDVLQNWPLEAIPQGEDGMCYAPKITPDMRPIDFNQDAFAVHNHIRGLSPWPGATLSHNNDTLKILRSDVVTDISGTVGMVMAVESNGIVVACQQRAVRLLELQRPGKKAQPAAEFLKGYNINVGDQINASA